MKTEASPNMESGVKDPTLENIQARSAVQTNIARVAEDISARIQEEVTKDENYDKENDTVLAGLYAEQASLRKELRGLEGTLKTEPKSVMAEEESTPAPAAESGPTIDELKNRERTILGLIEMYNQPSTSKHVEVSGDGDTLDKMYAELKAVRAQIRTLGGENKEGSRPASAETTATEKPKSGWLRRGARSIKENLNLMGEGHSRGMNPERGQPYVQERKTEEEPVKEEKEKLEPALETIDTNEPETITKPEETVTPEPAQPEADQNKKAEKPAQVGNKEKVEREQEVADFIKELKLETVLPPTFANLSTEQQLLALDQLKQRIVDLVKTDARTQYSEELKGKSWFKKILTGIKKEGKIKNFEASAFAKIRDTDEGKQIIAADLVQLTEMAGRREVQINSEGDMVVQYINPAEFNATTAEEKEALENFNEAANNFAQVPYEWSQGKGGNKKEYEETKAEYEEARRAVLMIEKKTTNQEEAMTSMLQLDNALKMEQLLTTHPEVEKEFERIAQTAGGREAIKTGWNTLQTLTGGKNLTNKFLFGAGIGLRVTTAALGLASWATAPITGAVIGGFRGRVRGKETLETRKKEARHGSKDTSKERVVTTDVTRLTKRLQDLVDQINNAPTDRDRAKQLSLLAVRIEHTQGKIEKGEVNFGDAKTSLNNQFNLVNSLNSALVLQATSGENDVEFRKRIDSRLKFESAHIAEKTSAKQKAYVNKQMRNGALMGAGAATVGYTLRWAGEQLGWWGGHGVAHVAPGKNLHPNAPAHPDTSSAHATLSPQKPDTATMSDTLHAPKPESAGVVQPKIDTVHTTGAAARPESAAAIIPGAGAAEKGVKVTVESWQGHTLDHPATFEIGHESKGLENAYEKLILDHTNMPKTGIALDQAGATRTLNEAANLVRLSEGHNTVGITAGEFKDAVEIKDGALNIKNPEKFYSIWVRLHAHSQELMDKGTFKSLDSATGEIKNVDWLERIHADGMHDTAAGPGTGILGHTEVTADQIENFGGETYADIKFPDIKPVHVDIDIDKITPLKAHIEALMNQPIGVPAEQHTGITSADVLEQTPTTKAPAEAVARTISEVPGTYQPYHPPVLAPEQARISGEYGTYKPYGQPSFALSPEIIIQHMNSVYRDNIVHLFPNDNISDPAFQNALDTTMKLPATELVEMSKEAGASGEDAWHGAFFKYFAKIKEVLGEDFKPKGKGFFSKPETTEHYIKRALQRASDLGKLDKLKIE